MRAHANCVENLPVFAAIVFAAEFVGYSSTLFGQLAGAVLLARVGQTVAHLWSNSELAVSVRFAFFAVQLFAFFVMTGLVLCSSL